MKVANGAEFMSTADLSREDSISEDFFPPSSSQAFPHVASSVFSAMEGVNIYSYRAVLIRAALKVVKGVSVFSGVIVNAITRNWSKC